jgi:hypothetical protein
MRRTGVGYEITQVATAVNTASYAPIVVSDIDAGENSL